MGSLGDALVNPGMFLGASKVVNSDGVTDAENKGRLTGYSIVEADSMDAAVEIAKRCPHVEHSTIEVAKIEMEM
jgi:hypothetical protein